MKNFVSVVALAALFSTPAFATPVAGGSGNTSTATGQATAKVIAPIVLTHTNNAVLAFGTFTPGQGGTVAVTTAGSGSVTGDVGFAPGSTNSADAFSVAGDNSRNFSITTASGTITGTKGGTMTFTTTPSAATGTTNGSGTATFTVGGTLTVPANQTADSYTGTYSVTVTYN